MLSTGWTPTEPLVWQPYQKPQHACKGHTAILLCEPLLLVNNILALTYGGCQSMHIAAANKEHLSALCPLCVAGRIQIPFNLYQNQITCILVSRSKHINETKKRTCFCLPNSGSTTHSGIPSAYEYQSLNRCAQPTALTFTSFKSILAL